MAAAVLAALLVSCGDEEGSTAPVVAATTTAVVARAPHTADLTTTDGNRSRITLTLGPRSATGGADECPGPATQGRAYLPVTLTVANQATDRPVPFPPVRIEMTAAPGTKPAQVLVRDTAGNCTFAPRVPSIGPGGSVVFKGTSPAIDDAAAPGTAGAIEVKVSETTFSLAAPVP